jgi:PilZ domain
METTESPHRRSKSGEVSTRADSKSARTRRAHWETMAQESDEAVAYLKALKQPSGSQHSSQHGTATATAPAMSATAAAPPVELPDNAEPCFQGSEKRRSARYKCEGSVEIQEDGCDVRTWATFTDISLHGCYVEAQATYPAGSALQLKLEANGLKVECKAASVRVSYPYLGMGIAFIEMSDGDRTRLKELLATISRPALIMGPGFISTLPSCVPLDGSIPIPDPAAAVRSLLAFFENRHMLMRDDFMTIIAKSQLPPKT